VHNHYKSMGEAANENHEAAASHTPEHHDYSDYHQDDRGWYWTAEGSTPKDAPATNFKTEAQRFEDLHTRITQLNHQLDILFHDLTTFKQETEEGHRDLKHYIYGYAESHKHALEKIEGIVEKVQKDVEGKDYQAHFEQLHSSLQEGNQAVLMNMPHAVHSSNLPPSPH
jgi:mannose-binding lectin 1